jgi:hypothetical protein
MKTPDEIKRGLDCCRGIEAPCDGCPYNMETMDYDESVSMLHDDALAYIRQLEAERDAAVNDLGVVRDCKVCKHFSHKAYEEPCDSCGIRQAHWKWRGVKEEG